MEFSARNQLKGTVKSVKTAGVMADFVIELPDGQQVVSAITRGSVESMNIQEGDTVYAVIKSTDVTTGSPSFGGKLVKKQGDRKGLPYT